MIKKTKLNSIPDMLSCNIEHTMTVPEAQVSLVEYLVNNNIEGDIVELGCGRGFNTQHFASVFKNHNRNNIIYGFDTFCGYTKEDLIECLRNEPELAPGYLMNQNSDRWVVDESVIKTRMEDLGYDNVTKITKGDIKETTKKFTPKSGKISMLYIDCNIYGASKSGIDNLKKYFSDGCLVVIDSGFSHGQGTEADPFGVHTPDPLGGEHKALYEYSTESGNALFRTHFGNYISHFVEVKK